MSDNFADTNAPAGDQVMVDRVARYTKAREVLPAGASSEEVMRLAEWLGGGDIALDWDRLVEAARACAALEYDTNGRPRDYDALTPGQQAVYDGKAANIVRCYLEGQSL